MNGKKIFGHNHISRMIEKEKLGNPPPKKRLINNLNKMYLQKFIFFYNFNQNLLVNNENHFSTKNHKKNVIERNKLNLID